MKQNVFGVVAFLISLMVAGLWFWKQAPSIGYAETGVIMSEFTEAIKARKEFEGAQKEWDKNLKRINDSLLATMNRMKQEYEKASPKERAAMSQNLEKWNADLQRYSGAIKRMSEEKEKELMTPVLSKLNGFMKTWGRENGYDMIFGTMNGGNILQAGERFNVTRDLLKDLNESYRDLEKASGVGDSAVAANASRAVSKVDSGK